MDTVTTTRAGAQQRGKERDRVVERQQDAGRVRVGTAPAGPARAGAGRGDAGRAAAVPDGPRRVIRRRAGAGPGAGGPGAAGRDDAVPRAAGARDGARIHGRLAGAARDRVAAVRGRVAGTTRDAGLATAEYAIVMIAAVGFAGLLVVILSSGEVREALTSLVRSALSV